MEFGISIPNFRGAAHVGTFRRVAKAAEEAGLDDVWIGDHIVLARNITSPHPYSEPREMTGPLPWSEVGIRDMEATDPVYEPLTLLGFLSALTQRIRLALGTLVVPLRHPVVAAKMLSTLDVLCGGRLILGVGVGWIPEEYAAVGASWVDRGAVTDEYLDVMTALWREDHPGFEGRFYSLPPDICFYPKPVQRTIPIWVGGNSLPARRRAARIGTGWHGAFVLPDRIQRIREDITERLAVNGRSSQGFVYSNRVNLEVSDVDDPDHPCRGSVERIVESMERYAEAGTTHLQIATPPGPETEDVLEQLELFVTEIRPRLSWERGARG